MIGLALVTRVAVLGQGLRSTFVDSITKVFTADDGITPTDALGPLSPVVERVDARAEGVEVLQYE